MSSRKVLFMVWAVAILATGAGTWAVQSSMSGRLWVGQVFTLMPDPGTLRATGTGGTTVSASTEESKYTLQIPRGTSVTLEWNCRLPASFEWVALPTTSGNTRNEWKNGVSMPNAGSLKIDNIVKSETYRLGCQPYPYQAGSYARMINIVVYDKAIGPYTQTFGVAPGEFSAVGANGEFVKSTLEADDNLPPAISIPTGNSIILSWNCNVPGPWTYWAVLPTTSWEQTASARNDWKNGVSIPDMGTLEIPNVINSERFRIGCQPVPYQAGSFARMIEVALTPQACGDSKLSGSETCDDGTNNGTAGCSTACKVMPGWVCSGSPSVCVNQCGNNVINAGETCDDGNATAGDGCSKLCTIETGYRCSAAGQACATVCGDRVIKGTEQCEDGNVSSGDGCSSVCAVESGYSCPTAGQACQKTCSNGTKDAGEECDDRNVTAGDGCSASCFIETGYACPTAGQACQTVCGDGVIKGSELWRDYLASTVGRPWR